jgi:hypothetical protein
MYSGKKLKISIVIVAVALSLVVGLQSLSVTWTSSSMSMHAGVADTVSLSIFEDCGCTTPLSDIWWGSEVRSVPNTISPGDVVYTGSDTTTKGDWQGVYGRYAHIFPNPPVTGLEIPVGSFSTPVGGHTYDDYGWTYEQKAGLPYNRTDPTYWDEYASLNPKINYTLTGSLINMPGIGPIQYPVFEWGWDNFNSSDPRAIYFEMNVPGAGGPGTRLTCWDDGAENHYANAFNVTMEFPAGCFMLSLYAYDKERASNSGKRDNQTIYVTNEYGTILAFATMNGTEFDEGMYVKFVVCGPTTIIVKVMKSPSSINALLSGIFVDNYTYVSQDQTYEFPIYVRNTGTRALYITYRPHDVYFDDGQSHFVLDCFVVEEGLPCQMSNVGPLQLPEKIPSHPNMGYLLNPGKVIKVLIELYVDSLVSGRCYDWDFQIHGATGDPQ